MIIRMSTLMKRGMSAESIHILRQAGYLTHGPHAETVRTLRPPSSWPKRYRELWRSR